MEALWQNALFAVVGLSSGLAVGSAFVALLVVLDVIPRMAQLTRMFQRAHWFEGAVICGAMYWTCADFFEWRLRLTGFILPVAGLFLGTFVGMIAAALTEVLNVFPILAKRLKMESCLIALLLAMVFGKIAGSLFDWLLFRLLWQ
ncbi:stage V sporulation protein AB [Paenibacillus turpanensis]|uniref:stage V sporulation protein AB n=1 Tax=Paenibacillus turpanensis TaxID=2689078 RepID=UPI00140D37E3|nr:stage V sporulation protein AB [Paenibacillus turpanensis]